MKTNLKSRKKAMRTRNLIIVLALLPLLSFSMTQKNSNLLPLVNYQFDVQEEELMKDWITDITTCSNEGSENIEPEEEVAIEQWMADLNDKLWHTEAAEEDFEIEEWMYNLDSDFWKLNRDEEEIKIENWMCNPSSWLVSN